MKDPGRHRKPRHHQSLLGPDMGFPLQLRGYDRLGGDIPGPQVLFQGQVDEAVDEGEIINLSILLHHRVSRNPRYLKSNHAPGLCQGLRFLWGSGRLVGTIFPITCF